ncbi:MAG: LamG domain-containing protein [Patescibacteria group bacterium]|nr:LamG domain-containing protein [Patescibacteria group bacterium]
MKIKSIAIFLALVLNALISSSALAQYVPPGGLPNNAQAPANSAVYASQYCPYFANPSSGASNVLASVPDNALLRFGVGNKFSVECFVRVEADPVTYQYQIFVWKNGASGINYGIAQEPTSLYGVPCFSAGAVTATPSATILPRARWTQLVAVYDGTNLTLYVDGQVAGTVAATTIDNGAGAPLNIGGNNNNNSPGSELGSLCNVCEVSIWNTNLTQAQIKSHRTAPLKGNETGLVALYHMNEGSGTTLVDSGPNGLNGTYSNVFWDERVHY